MKKKISALLIVFIISLLSVIPVMAAESDGFADEYYRVSDMAGLLTDSEKETLIAKLDEISVRQKMDIVVVTAWNSDNYPVVEYAETLYEECKFGYGEAKDGILLFISLNQRDWYIATHGYGITAFTDAGIEYIGEKITPYMSEDEWFEAFDKYADLCDSFITQARSDAPYDKGNLPREALSLVWIPISFVIGFVIAMVVVGSMKSQLKSVRRQTAANNYVRNGSMNISEQREMFLYNTVTKTAKPTSSNNGGSGGSSTHKSSSGSTFGGGGGKF